ncbi:MAG: M55 family metallopeptidase [Gemmatimonadota bacterium]|nr:M55 family metallopeptidase [Gemmatimonadota bacterium]
MRRFVLLALFGATLPLSLGAQGPRKLFVSVDMEGIAGVVTGEQLGPGGFEYERFRRFTTEEVLAVIRGARATGVTEFLVADAHGNGQNLLLELFPADVQVIRSWPRPLGMMEGIDSTFDAAVFVGYHAGTTNPDGVRAHTFSSARLTDVRLNGRSVPEGGVNAAIAGYFGVPVILVTGDAAAVAEVRSVVGDIEGAVVKWPVSFHSARTLTPQAATALIEERTRAALARVGTIRPHVLSGPVTLDVSFKHYQPSQLLALLPGVERTDAHSIRYVGPDILAISRFLTVINNYSLDLEP